MIFSAVVISFLWHPVKYNMLRYSIVTINALQVLFGPRRCDGVGLSDGEMMERLWSYMRRFSRMTKEMRPSHRIDVLCSALVYYGLQKKRKFGMCSAEYV